MRIRKARLSDWGDYYKLKVEESFDYKKIIGKSAKLPSKNKLKKEFDEFIKNKNFITFIVDVEDKVVAYSNCKIHKSVWSNGGYVDDIFVLKNYRKNGIATELIKEFIRYLKYKRLNQISLNVNQKNIDAIKLYKKLGFELVQYGMRKKLK